MTTSPYGYRVRIGSQFGAAGDPISAVYARRVALNNLCHYADVFGQVRAGWSVAPDVAGKGYLEPTAPAAADTPYFIWATTFPIFVRADGSSYKLRVRIGGLSSGGHAVRFRAVLSAPLVNARKAVDAADYVYLTATTTSGTEAWLTGTSMGAGAYATMITMSAADVAGAMTVTSTLADVAGAARSVAQPVVMLAIYGQTANVASTPRLYSVYAAEWVGD